MMRSRLWKRLRSSFFSRRWAARADRRNLELRKVAALELLVSKFDELTRHRHDFLLVMSNPPSPGSMICYWYECPCGAQFNFGSGVSH